MTSAGSPGFDFPEDQPTNRSRSRLILLSVFLLFTIASVLCVIVGLPLTFAHSPWLGVQLHSVLFADYRADQASSRFPPAGVGLIQELIEADDPEQAPKRMATLISALQTPVPTATGLPVGTPLLPHHTNTPTPDTAPVGITETVPFTLTPVITMTASPTGTAAQAPTHTPTIRKTSIFPSPTATQRPPEPPRPTKPPSPTQEPTSTQVPSSTPVPYIPPVPPATPYP